MRIRKKMLSVFCAAMLLGTITSVTVPQVQASEYIMLGECSITKAGRNRIYVYSGTTARTTVNLVSTIIYVDRYNAEKDAWGQIAGWSKDAENDYFVSTSKYITVEPGYYYRVRADHFAGMQYPYESTYSFTDGIMIK